MFCIVEIFDIQGSTSVKISIHSSSIVLKVVSPGIFHPFIWFHIVESLGRII